MLPLGSELQVAAALYNNRALARLKMRQWMPASTDASAAASLSPAWPKPCFRLAQVRSRQATHIRRHRGKLVMSFYCIVFGLSSTIEKEAISKDLTLE